MMSHSLYRLGRFAARRPWAVIGAWLVVSVLVVAASSTFGQKLEDSFGAPGVDSQRATDLLAAAGSDQAGLTAQVVVTPRADQVTFFNSAEARAALSQVQSAAAQLPHVLGTSDPAGTTTATPGVLSPDGRVAIIRLQYPVLEELDRGDLENLKAFAARAGQDLPVRIELGGDLFFAFEEPESGLGEAIGLFAAIVVLLLAFGSIIAMGLPIGMALFGLALGISSMSLVAYLIDIPSWAPVLGSMVGLGVGIDYALILVTRHREHLAHGLSVEESAGRAVGTAGRSVVFAGGTVVIAILGLAVAGVPFMTAGGVAISLIVLTMVLVSITLLPAFLGLAGHWINRLASGEWQPPRVPAGIDGHCTLPDMQPRMSSVQPFYSSRLPRRCSRSGSARQTTARFPTTGRSAGPTTWSPPASVLGSTGRWSSPSTSPRTRASYRRSSRLSVRTKGSRTSRRPR